MDKKQLIVILAALSLAALCITGLIILDSTPVLHNGDALPDDITSRAYSLKGFTYDPDEGCSKLTLYIGSFAPGALYLDFEQLDNMMVTVNGADAKLSVIPSKKTGMRWLIDTAGMTRGEALNLRIYDGTRKTYQPYSKLLLTSTTEAVSISTIAYVANFVTNGIMVMVIFASLSLYLAKRSETYLLFFAIGAAASFINTLTFFPKSPLFGSTMVGQFVTHLFTHVPIITNAALCCFLYADCMPKKIQRSITPLRLTIIAIAWVFIDNWLRSLFGIQSSFHIVRWLVMLLILFTLSRAVIRRKRFAWIILLSVVIYNSFFDYNMLVTIGFIEGGPLTIYIRIAQFAYLTLLLGCIIVINDRFGRKFAEAERLSASLSEINADLDAKVEKRTKELKDEQQKKHVMLTNIFHDLRNPIFVLRGSLEQIQTYSDEDLETKHLMQARLGYLEQLTDDLFLTAKLEEGDAVFAYERTPLTPLLRSIVEGEIYPASEKGVTVEFSSMQDLTVWGDPLRLQQAFVNLVVNAVTYSSTNGKVFVSVAAEGDQVRVCVQDTGKGIAPEDLPNVFDRYYRSSQANNKKSSGLGLSIAREIIHAHWGSIEVTSEVGTGTTFSVILPLMQDETT